MTIDNKSLRTNNTGCDYEFKFGVVNLRQLSFIIKKKTKKTNKIS